MLNIDNSETEQAIYRLAQHLGITPTEAIAVAIHRELARLEQKRQTEFERISQAADAVRRECSP